MLSGLVFKGGMLLRRRLPTRKWGRTEMGARTVRILARSQSAALACLYTIHLLNQDLSKALAAGTCCAEAESAGLFGFRMAIAALATPGTALALLSSGRRRRRGDRGVHQHSWTWLGDVLCTRTGPQGRGHVLAAERNLVEAVRKGPRLILREGVHGLPDRPVSGKNFLKGRTPQGLVRRYGQGKRQKLVVKPFDDEKVHLLEHGQRGGENGQGFADSWLHRARKLRRSWSVRAASIMPGNSVSFGASGTPRKIRRRSRSEGMLECGQEFRRRRELRSEQLTRIA